MYLGVDHRGRWSVGGCGSRRRRGGQIISSSDMVSELWGVDSAFAGVTAVVERDLNLFFAESGGAEESLGVFSGGCFENQCAIGWSFNLYRVVRTADGGDLLLGPEDVQLSERDGVIDGLDNKKRTERRQIRSIGRAVIVCAVDGCVSQIRAWVGDRGVGPEDERGSEFRARSLDGRWS